MASTMQNIPTHGDDWTEVVRGTANPVVLVPHESVDVIYFVGSAKPAAGASTPAIKLFRNREIPQLSLLSDDRLFLKAPGVSSASPINVTAWFG